MSFLSDLTELVKAVGAIITAVQKHPAEPAINKPHFWTTGACNSGCIHKTASFTISPHCQRCGAIFTQATPIAERCPFFT